MQEAVSAAEAGNKDIQLQSKQQLQAQLLVSQEAAAAKDAEVAQAAQKLYDLTQQLAAHEHANDSASASR